MTDTSDIPVTPEEDEAFKERERQHTPVPSPIRREHAKELAAEFERRRAQDPDQSIEELLFSLMDTGDIIWLDTDECMELVTALIDIGFDAADGDGVTPKLQSAFQRVSFAHGRHFGLMNFDMGIEEEDADGGRTAG